MHGLEELRVKESDRLAAIVAGLEAIGVSVEQQEDTLIVHGQGQDGVRGGAHVATHMDHRIAMAFLIAGLMSGDAVTVDDVSMVATSFPDFEPHMRDLGADFAEPQP
jgi:3-phosphoshikimate 1-carboxyvinyltransferase